MVNAVSEHPIFVRARNLPERLRPMFPQSREEAADWKETTFRRALAARVLVVARTRIECAWAAYIDAVPGQNHLAEEAEVLNYGAKVPEDIARLLFPMFDEVPYAE